MNEEDNLDVKEGDSQSQSDDSSSQDQADVQQSEDQNETSEEENKEAEKQKKGLEEEVQKLKDEVTDLRSERRVLDPDRETKPKDTEGEESSEEGQESEGYDRDDVREAVEAEVEPLKERTKQRQEEMFGLVLADLDEEDEFHKIHSDKDAENKNFNKVREVYKENNPNGHATVQGMKEGLKRAYAYVFPDEYAEARAEAAKKEGQKQGANAMRANAGGASSDLKGPSSTGLTDDDKRMLQRFNRGRPEDEQMTEEEFLKYKKEDPEMPY